MAAVRQRKCVICFESPVRCSVTALAAGRYHSLALLSDGAVCAWGSNARGQLGDGSPLGNTTAGQTHPNPNPNPDPNPNPNPYPNPNPQP